MHEFLNKANVSFKLTQLKFFNNINKCTHTCANTHTHTFACYTKARMPRHQNKEQTDFLNSTKYLPQVLPIKKDLQMSISKCELKYYD